MANIFHVPNLTNKPSRNGFDLSHKNSFTAKIGELLPIMHRTLMPGDKCKLRIQHRSVTTPLESSAFTRFTEYFDFFFVPYEQLYRNTPQIMTQMQNNPQYAASSSSAVSISTQLPWFNSADVVNRTSGPGDNSSFFRWLEGNVAVNPKVNYQGFSLCYEALKLWNYLGASYVPESWFTDKKCPNSHPYSVFPWAAYQKIYFDYYRFEQWEKNLPQCYNFDYLTGNLQFTNAMMRAQDPQSNLFTLRHCNYPKDLFFGILPSPQYDAPSVASAHVYSSEMGSNTGKDQIRIDYKDPIYIEGNDENNSDTLLPLGILGDARLNPGSSVLTRADLGIDIVELRRAKALQRFREVIGTGNQDYVSMVKKIYGEDIPKHYDHRVRYLGGFSNGIDVSTVVNNNLAETTAEPDMKGIGVSEDKQGFTLDFDCDTHGVIMCIYRVLPLIDYALVAPHFDIVKTEVDDYANPFFDRLGLQELPSMFLSDTQNPQTIGYVPRYFDYKTSVDVVNGNFREEFKHWISAFTDDFVRSWLGDPGMVHVTKDFFKVNSHLADTVFFLKSTQSVTSDQFMVNANISFKCVRNLDYDGLPKGN